MNTQLRNDLWEAINWYARTVGHPLDNISVDRMNAVSAIERTLEKIVAADTFAAAALQGMLAADGNDPRWTGKDTGPDCQRGGGKWLDPRGVARQAWEISQAMLRRRQELWTGNTGEPVQDDIDKLLYSLSPPTLAHLMCDLSDMESMQSIYKLASDQLATDVGPEEFERLLREAGADEYEKPPRCRCCQGDERAVACECAAVYAGWLEEKARKKVGGVLHQNPHWQPLLPPDQATLDVVERHNQFIDLITRLRKALYDMWEWQRNVRELVPGAIAEEVYDLLKDYPRS